MYVCMQRVWTRWFTNHTEFTYRRRDMPERIFRLLPSITPKNLLLQLLLIAALTWLVMNLLAYTIVVLLLLLLLGGDHDGLFVNLNWVWSRTEHKLIHHWLLSVVTTCGVELMFGGLGYRGGLAWSFEEELVAAQIQTLLTALGHFVTGGARLDWRAIDTTYRCRGCWAFEALFFVLTTDSTASCSSTD